MITERDLDEAIAECQGKRNPDTSTCIKLAAFMIIRDHLYSDNIIPQGYTRASGIDYTYNSGTEFSNAIIDKDIETILPVIDELMETLRALNPRLYNGVLRKLSSI